MELDLYIFGGAEGMPLYSVLFLSSTLCPPIKYYSFLLIGQRLLNLFLCVHFISCGRYGDVILKKCLCLMLIFEKGINTHSLNNPNRKRLTSFLCIL